VVLERALTHCIVTISTDVLDLGHNFLKGTIPKDVGKMKDATRLYLTGNSLTGTIPVDIGKIKDLGMSSICIKGDLFVKNDSHICYFSP
jgi:hypothetical protein